LVVDLKKGNMHFTGTPAVAAGGRYRFIRLVNLKGNHATIGLLCSEACDIFQSHIE
jgi:hypothetical protein